IGLGLPPPTETKLFHAPPDNSGQPAIATLSTPGTIRRLSAIGSHTTGGWPCCATTSINRSCSGEKPKGLLDKLSKVLTNSPDINITRKQNATCAAIIPCMRRRRE